MNKPRTAGFIVTTKIPVIINYFIVVSPLIIEVVSAPIMFDVVSIVDGLLIVLVELSVVVELSVPFPQAVKTPAKAMIAKNFFIVLVFMHLLTTTKLILLSKYAKNI